MPHSASYAQGPPGDFKLVILAPDQLASQMEDAMEACVH